MSTLLMWLDVASLALRFVGFLASFVLFGWSILLFTAERRKIGEGATYLLLLALTLYVAWYLPLIADAVR